MTWKKTYCGLKTKADAAISFAGVEGGVPGQGMGTRGCWLLHWGRRLWRSTVYSNYPKPFKIFFT